MSNILVIYFLCDSLKYSFYVHDIYYTRDQHYSQYNTKHTTSNLSRYTRIASCCLIILSLDYVFTWVSLYPLGILDCTITHLMCIFRPVTLCTPPVSFSLFLFLYFLFSPLIFLCILYTTSLTSCVTLIEAKPTRSKCVRKKRIVLPTKMIIILNA